MEITFSCGTCSSRFSTITELRHHREDAHPDLNAGYVAYEQVKANGGTDEEADAAADKAEREYRLAVRA
jgi:hypothetical protein